jgi:anaerobic magnesium-protoporphyrin IX monomethyl ester cyclase
MRFNRVLFVNPPSRGEWRGIRPHIGLGYLAQAIEDAGIEHGVFDMNLGYSLGDLRRKIHDFRPDLIAITLLTLEYKKFYRLIADIKTAYPSIAIAAGGPHVTILKSRVLAELPELDFGIVFEGEAPLLELCGGELGYINIQNLIWRNGEQIISNPPRKFLMDLDSLSWPRYNKFELNRYIKEAEIYSSRGCPHECIFCPNRLISPVFRSRSPKHVVDEMEHWYARGYRQFNFDDDNFNYIRKRVFDICDEIEKRGLKNLFLRCSNGVRADRIDREMLVRMREVGFHYIAFGVDAGNDRMLEIIKKGEEMHQIESAVKLATELKYDVKLLFVVGTPGETREDVEDKVRFSRKFDVKDAHFYNIIPYPGTELFDYITDNNLFLRDPEDYLNDVTCLENTPVFETSELSRDERIETFRYLRKVQNEIHRNAIKGMFAKYGPLSGIAGRLFANETVERLFYQSFFVRGLAEKLRYRRAVDGKPVANNRTVSITIRAEQIARSVKKPVVENQVVIVSNGGIEAGTGKEQAREQLTGFEKEQAGERSAGSEKKSA